MLVKAFTPFPLLRTERLTLRQLMQTDVNAIFALRSDSEINKYLERQPSRTLEDAENFINMITVKITKNESVYWAIVLNDNETFLGTVCLFNFSEKQEKCEIGYELLGNFQGKGFMNEAADKVINYAFQTTKIQTIEAYSHKNNQRSVNLLIKLGFKELPEYDKTNPDFITYSLTKK